MGASRGPRHPPTLDRKRACSRSLAAFLAWSSRRPRSARCSKFPPAASRKFSIGLSIARFSSLRSWSRVITGLLFGIAPALRTTKLDLRETLNEGSRGSTAGPGHHRLRGVLDLPWKSRWRCCCSSVPACCLRSFERLQDAPIGFQPDHLFVADLPLSQTAYAGPSIVTASTTVSSIAPERFPAFARPQRASFLPVSGGGSIIHFNITGHPPKSPHEYVAAGYCTVTRNYFETLGVPLLQGRYLTRSDNEHSPSVVVINTTMAHTFFPNENPLGRRIQLGATPDNDVPTMEIVGVVGDVTQGLGIDPKAEMFLPYRQGDQLLPVFQLSLVMRTAADPRQEPRRSAARVAEIDPESADRQSPHHGRQHGHHRGAAAFSHVAHRHFRRARAAARRRRHLRRHVVLRHPAYQRNRHSRHAGRATQRRISHRRRRRLALRTTRRRNRRHRRSRPDAPAASFLYGISAYDPLNLYWPSQSS